MKCVMVVPFGGAAAQTSGADTQTSGADAQTSGAAGQYGPMALVTRPRGVLPRAVR